MVREDHERLRAAGLSDEAIVQAVSIGAYFNYVTRVADATGLEFDYDSPLPRLQPDRRRAPLERPPPAEWPRFSATGELSLALRPATGVALEKWCAYAFERHEPLSVRERAVVARAAAWQCCDAAGVERWPDAEPRTDRERALAAYAAKLTLCPWQMTAEDLSPLRALGLEDRALLDLISLTALQNVLSRLRLGLPGR